MGAERRRAYAAQRTLRRVRALHGLSLLVAPRAMVAGVADRPADNREIVFARILGFRQGAEALLNPPLHPRRRAAGALVDAIHAVTALALARRNPRRARALHANAALATGLAVAGVLVRPERA